jgi:hypothetical protein
MGNEPGGMRHFRYACCASHAGAATQNDPPA